MGIKELWDVQPGKIDTGYVAHTLGWPLRSDLYGGGWVYGLQNNRVSLGMVVGTGISRSAVRSARSISEIQNPSIRQEKFSKAAR